MTATLSPTSVQFSQRIYSKEIVLNARLRRSLLSRLEQLDQTLIQFGKDDQLTKLIKAWKFKFHAALRTHTFNEGTRDDFCSQLKDILVDSLPCQMQEGGIFFPPLDEEALLGSDGFTYGKRWLSVVFAQIPEEDRTFSPLKQMDEPFSLQPHLPARFLLQWLSGEGGITSLPEIDALYSQLEGEVPTLPGLKPGLQSRIARLQKIEREKKAAAERQAMEQAKQDVEAFIRPQFDALEEETLAVQQRVEQKRVEVQAELKREIAAITKQIEELECSSVELISDIKRAHGTLDGLDSEFEQLEIATIELEKEIARAKKSGFGAVLCAVSSIVVTAALSLFAPGGHVVFSSKGFQAGAMLAI